jgi:hypothetical protein
MIQAPSMKPTIWIGVSGIMLGLSCTMCMSRSQPPAEREVLPMSQNTIVSAAASVSVPGPRGRISRTEPPPTGATEPLRRTSSHDRGMPPVELLLLLLLMDPPPPPPTSPPVPPRGPIHTVQTSPPTPPGPGQPFQPSTAAFHSLCALRAFQSHALRATLSSFSPPWSGPRYKKVDHPEACGPGAPGGAWPVGTARAA